MCGEGAEFLEWNIGEVGWVYVAGVGTGYRV